ncbi:MAG: acetate kinase [Ruminococcaceae bacterium]|nr:acetate kinase [Oscillospiraceae bacterium]
MKVLVINAGSSSLKYQLMNPDTNEVICKGLIERIGIDGKLTHKPQGKEDFVLETKMDNHQDAIKVLIDALIDADHGVVKSMDEIDAVGHRVVHAGEYFNDSVLVTEEVLKKIEACVELAPLHNPPNILGIKACQEIMPSVPQVAVFDTAFHQSMPKEAYLYAVPYEYYEKYKVRKFGFHGTSHKYVAGRAAAMLNKPIEDLKIITCHLGNGSSISAVKGGKSIETSMGFTPLAGVCMGTRSGDIDPAIVEFIATKENLSVSEVLNILNKKSGVLGVSGLSSDFRDLLGDESETKERSILAVDMFVYHVKKQIGICAAVMGGVDAVVFTAGVGENTEYVRKNVVDGLEFMGIEIDPELNKERGYELDISKKDAKVRTLIIPTNEELMIALDTKKLVESK